MKPSANIAYSLDENYAVWTYLTWLPFSTQFACAGTIISLLFLKSTRTKVATQINWSWKTKLYNPDRHYCCKNEEEEDDGNVSVMLWNYLSCKYLVIYVLIHVKQKFWWLFSYFHYCELGDEVSQALVETPMLSIVWCEWVSKSLEMISCIMIYNRIKFLGHESQRMDSGLWCNSKVVEVVCFDV